MNFYLTESLGVEFTANKGKMMQKVALTSFTLQAYDEYRSFAPHAN